MQCVTQEVIFIKTLTQRCAHHQMRISAIKRISARSGKCRNDRSIRDFCRVSLKQSHLRGNSILAFLTFPTKDVCSLRNVMKDTRVRFARANKRRIKVFFKIDISRYYLDERSYCVPYPRRVYKIRGGGRKVGENPEGRWIHGRNSPLSSSA